MNLPNKITLFRVCLIPVFLLIYLPAPFGENMSQLCAMAVFLIASASDALDGHIARSRNLITNFGKLMDPLADKLLVSAALIAMTQTQVMPAWAVIIIISREFFISGYRQLALEGDNTAVMAASFWAKVKTATQMVMIIFLLLPLSSSTAVDIIKWILIGASVVFSIMSAVEYVVKNNGKVRMG